MPGPTGTVGDLDLDGLPNARRDVELAPYTTFGIGGPADLFAVPETVDQLVAAVRWAQCAQLDWFILGCGANILVGDEGFRGLVVKNDAARIEIDGSTMIAETGASVAEALRISVDRGLSG